MPGFQGNPGHVRGLNFITISPTNLPVLMTALFFSRLVLLLPPFLCIISRSFLILALYVLHCLITPLFPRVGPVHLVQLRTVPTPLFILQDQDGHVLVVVSLQQGGEIS